MRPCTKNQGSSKLGGPAALLIENPLSFEVLQGAGVAEVAGLEDDGVGGDVSRGGEQGAAHGEAGKGKILIEAAIERVTDHARAMLEGDSQVELTGL